MTRSDHAPSPDCVVSFRHLLDDALEGFLTEAGLGGRGLVEVLGELAVSLSRYHEEGQLLFPQAYLADGLGPMLDALGGAEALQVGVGPRTRETVQRALRQCARLAEGGWWALYLVLHPEGLAYGVFRTDPFPLAETPLDRLHGAAADGPVRVAGVLQLAENVVELRARGGVHRHVYLSGARAEQMLPTLALDGLAQAATAHAPEAQRADLRRFLLRVLFETMQVGHGALVAVVDGGRACGSLFADAVLLDVPLDLTARLARYARLPDAEARADVAAAAALLRGMMAADGITVLRSDGCVLGYNAFVRHPDAGPSASGVAGGARRRTFEVLCRGLGHDLCAVFMRSQDGALHLRRL